MSHHRYFNFPVCFLKDFLTDTKSCLNNIFDYSLYAYSQIMYLDDEYDFEGMETEIVDMIRMDCALEFYGCDMCESKIEMQLMRSKGVYQEASFHAPKVGLNLDIFHDFYNNDKSEFEKVCLLAFLGLKSIIGTKSYCKTDNKYLLSRMNGSAVSHDIDRLPDALKKYAGEYQLKKIKKELVKHWGLKTYSRYTRGFYVSYALDLENLMYEAEKKRKTNTDKQRKLEEKAMLEKVLKKLAGEVHQ